jgi:hypothetical protein
MFYYDFIYNIVLLLSNQNTLKSVPVLISGKNYTIITTDKNIFSTQFGSTNQTLTALTGMNCLIDNYLGNVQYSSFIKDTSSTWLIYNIAGLFSFCIFNFMI